VQHLTIAHRQAAAERTFFPAHPASAVARQRSRSQCGHCRRYRDREVRDDDTARL